MITIDKPQDCPLCNGTGWMPQGNPENPTGYYTRCDHTYLMVGNRVIATGNGASLLFGAMLAVAVCFVFALIAVFIS